MREGGGVWGAWIWCGEGRGSRVLFVYLGKRAWWYEN